MINSTTLKNETDMIKIENRQVFSTDGRLIRRRGTETCFRRAIALGGDTPEQYEEVDGAPAYTKAEYDAKVTELIRQRYSADEEFALQRKMLAAMLHPEAATLEEDGAEAATPEAVGEFEAYNAFAEQCKADAPAAIAADKARMAEEQERMETERIAQEEAQEQAGQQKAAEFAEEWQAAVKRAQDEIEAGQAESDTTELDQSSSITTDHSETE